MLVSLIDDDIEVIRCTEEIVLAEGHEVISFTNATDAITYLRENRVDSAFIDRKLPDMDGFSLISSVRQSPVNRRTPIAVITGFADSESMRIAFQHGANFFIAKPITTDNLRSVLNLINAGITSERRRAVRVPFSGAVFCVASSGTFEVQGVNISETGALLSGDLNVVDGSVVELRFCLLMAKPLKLRARVIHRNEDSYVSFAFLDIAEEERQEIREYVNRNARAASQQS